MEKTRNIAFVAIIALLLFSAILYQGADAWFPGFEAEKTSNAEGRTFVAYESVAEHELIDGTFQDEFELYAADSIPNKDLFVITNAALQRQGVSTAATLFGYDVYPTFFGSDYLASPTDKRIYAMPTEEPGDNSKSMGNLDTWCTTISQAAAAHPDVRFVVDIVPQVRQDEANPAYRFVRGKSLMDEEWIEREWGGRLDEQIDFNVDGISGREELQTQWFTTDHHWTLERALRTYNAIGAKLGWADIEYGDGEIVEVTPEWYGSDARRALDFEYASTMYDQADDFSSLTFYPIEEGVRADSPFNLGKREVFLAGEVGSGDIAKYSAYTDYYGNGSVWIENSSNKNGKTCLLVADSYGYGIRRYIALNYQTTITIFPGNHHVAHTLDWYIDEYDVDDAVFVSHAQAYDFIARESHDLLAGSLR